MIHHCNCNSTYCECYKNLNKIRRTPFEPSGLVKILAIAKDKISGAMMAQVEYIHDHPHGYKKGDLGWYFLHELRHK